MCIYNDEELKDYPFIKELYEWHRFYDNIDDAIKIETKHAKSLCYPDIDSNTLHILLFEVQSDYRLKGEGRKLLSKIEKRAADMDLCGVSLHSYDKHSDEFYKHCGYTKSRDQYYYKIL